MGSLDDRLAGLLSLHSSIDDHEDALMYQHQSPRLILHLHLLNTTTNKSPSDDVPTKIRSALDAITELFIDTERVRFSSTLRTALWRRVVMSRMMATPLQQEDNDATHWRVTQPAPPLHVLLDLSGMATSVLAPLLHDFFQTTRPPGTRQMTLGVRVVRSGWQHDDFESLDSLLRGRNSTSNALIAPTLGRLHLQNKTLSAKALDAVAVLLRNHTVREVYLENVLGHTSSPKTLAAFQSVLKSVLSPSTEQHQCAATSNTIADLHLSLAGNSLDSRHFQAIADAISKATRPLRRLSLARTFPVDRDAEWRHLTRMLYSSAPQNTPNYACELDLSGNAMFDRDAAMLRKMRAALVQDHLTGTVQDALKNCAPVWCGVEFDTRSYSSPCTTVADPQRKPPRRLDSIIEYRVVSWWDDGWVEITDPNTTEHESDSDSDSDSQWITTTAITWLRVGTSELLRLRFTSLVLDDMQTNNETASSPVVVLMDVGLRKLSLRRMAGAYEILAKIAWCCPQLTHLDLEGCGLYSTSPLWAFIRHGTLREIQSLNLNGNRVDSESVEQLTTLLRELPEFRLRHVALCQNGIGFVGLSHLGQLLHENKTLEIMEMDATMDQDVHEAYAVQRRLLSGRHDGELLGVTPLPLQARLAFLSVLAVLSLCAIDTPVVSLILEFSASHVERRLQWR